MTLQTTENFRDIGQAFVIARLRHRLRVAQVLATVLWLMFCVSAAVAVWGWTR